MRAVAAGDVRRLTRFGRAIRPLDRASTRPAVSSNATSSVSRSTSTPASAQPIDQQPFVFVLRKDQHVGKRTDAVAHVAELGACHVPAGRPEIDCASFAVRGDDRVSEADLAVQLERPRVDGQRA